MGKMFWGVPRGAGSGGGLDPWVSKPLGVSPGVVKPGMMYAQRGQGRGVAMLRGASLVGKAPKHVGKPKGPKAWGKEPAGANPGVDAPGGKNPRIAGARNRFVPWESPGVGLVPRGMP
jgi:hypothetical protein